jgi:hypothetical protein
MKALCAALVMAFPVLAEAAVAGRVQFVAGDVRVVDAAGREQPMKKGQDINEGDTVLSAQSGSAQLRMIDGAIVALRPATQLKIVGYAFNGKEDGSERASFSLLKGGLRAITGLIGKTNKDHYKLETPTATIGIRGTDHEPVVVLPPAAGEAPGTPAGTYDKVNVGATSLTTQAGTTVVAANQVGFAASATQLPVILPKLPAFYRATTPPQAKQEKKHEQEQKQEQKQAQASSEPSGSTDSSQSDAKTDTATASTSTTTATLTGADASGNTLNLSSQTLTTSTGQQVSLTGGSLTTVAKPAQNDAVLFAVYPHANGTSPQGDTFYYPALYFFDGDAGGVTRDASGNVTAVSAANLQFADYRASLSQSGSTLTDLGKDAATGLSWGRWQGGQVTQTQQYFSVDSSGKYGLGAPDASGNFVIGGVQTDTAPLGTYSLHWIAGTRSSPDYLPQVLTGTANYAMIGGTHPTDTQGNVGTLSGASLSANFTSQTVNANVNFSIGGNNWAVQSKGMQLFDDAHFNSFANCSPTSCTSNVNITKNGTVLASTPTPTGSSAFGNLQGMLTGAGLNGAGLEYSVQESTPTTATDSSGNQFTTVTQNMIQGVAAFSGPAQDVNTSFRAIGINDGWGGDSHLFSGDNLQALASAGLYRGGVAGGVTAVSKVVDSSAGLTEFGGSARGYAPVSGVADSSLYYVDTPATIKIGSAVNRDVGSTSVGGVTVSWGRWEGGSVNIYSPDGTSKLGTIENSSRSIHWLSTSTLNSQSFAPPLTGTATYVIAGNTSPTDMNGNVGKLTSATLNADFTNAKVNAGVSVDFNSPTNTSTWTMTANNIPLGGDGGFKSNTTMDGVNGITHTTTCTGNVCGAQTVGQINGHFVAGAQGAAIFYTMASGTTSSSSTGTKSSLPNFTPVNMVSGLVVMKR